jgi:hypothetical protein
MLHQNAAEKLHYNALLVSKVLIMLIYSSIQLRSAAPPRGSLAMYMLIKDLPRSGMHVYANKGLTGWLLSVDSQFYLLGGPVVFR